MNTNAVSDHYVRNALRHAKGYPSEAEIRRAYPEQARRIEAEERGDVVMVWRKGKWVIEE